jgi:hypothetical protein
MMVASRTMAADFEPESESKWFCLKADRDGVAGKDCVINGRRLKEAKCVVE